MENVLTVLKILPGRTKQTVTFLQELNNRQVEMNNVLAESEIELDCSFIFPTPTADYVLIFKRIAEHQKLLQSLDGSDLPIYAEIKSWMDECIDRSQERLDLTSISTFIKRQNW